MIKCYQESAYNNYIITIGNSVYEMNSHANLPNGLNMYCGEDLQLKCPDDMHEIQLGDLPKGTLIGIILRLQFEHLKEKAGIYKEFINKLNPI